MARDVLCEVCGFTGNRSWLIPCRNSERCGLGRHLHCLDSIKVPVDAPDDLGVYGTLTCSICLSATTEQPPAAGSGAGAAQAPAPEDHLQARNDGEAAEARPQTAPKRQQGDDDERAVSSSSAEELEPDDDYMPKEAKRQRLGEPAAAGGSSAAPFAGPKKGAAASAAAGQHGAPSTLAGLTGTSNMGRGGAAGPGPSSKKAHSLMQQAQGMLRKGGRLTQLEDGPIGLSTAEQLKADMDAFDDLQMNSPIKPAVKPPAPVPPARPFRPAGPAPFLRTGMAAPGRGFRDKPVAGRGSQGPAYRPVQDGNLLQQIVSGGAAAQASGNKDADVRRKLLQVSVPSKFTPDGVGLEEAMMVMAAMNPHNSMVHLFDAIKRTRPRIAWKLVPVSEVPQPVLDVRNFYITNEACETCIIMEPRSIFKMDEYEKLVGMLKATQDVLLAADVLELPRTVLDMDPVLGSLLASQPSPNAAAAAAPQRQRRLYFMPTEVPINGVDSEKGTKKVLLCLTGSREHIHAMSGWHKVARIVAKGIVRPSASAPPHEQQQQQQQKEERNRKVTFSDMGNDAKYHTLREHKAREREHKAAQDEAEKVRHALVHREEADQEKQDEDDAANGAAGAGQSALANQPAAGLGSGGVAAVERQAGGDAGLLKQQANLSFVEGGAAAPDDSVAAAGTAGRAAGSSGAAPAVVPMELEPAVVTDTATGQLPLPTAAPAATPALSEASPDTSDDVDMQDALDSSANETAQQPSPRVDGAASAAGAAGAQAHAVLAGTSATDWDRLVLAPPGPSPIDARAKATLPTAWELALLLPHFKRVADGITTSVAGISSGASKATTDSRSPPQQRSPLSRHASLLERAPSTLHAPPSLPPPLQPLSSESSPSDSPPPPPQPASRPASAVGAGPDAATHAAAAHDVHAAPLPAGAMLSWRDLVRSASTRSSSGLPPLVGGALPSSVAVAQTLPAAKSGSGGNAAAAQAPAAVAATAQPGTAAAAAPPSRGSAGAGPATAHAHTGEELAWSRISFPVLVAAVCPPSLHALFAELQQRLPHLWRELQALQHKPLRGLRLRLVADAPEVAALGGPLAEAGAALGLCVSVESPDRAPADLAAFQVLALSDGVLRDMDSRRGVIVKSIAVHPIQVYSARPLLLGLQLLAAEARAQPAGAAASQPPTLARALAAAAAAAATGRGGSTRPEDCRPVLPQRVVVVLGARGFLDSAPQDLRRLAGAMVAGNRTWGEPWTLRMRAADVEAVLAQGSPEHVDLLRRLLTAGPPSLPGSPAAPWGAAAAAATTTAAAPVAASPLPGGAIEPPLLQRLQPNEESASGGGGGDGSRAAGVAQHQQQPVVAAAAAVLRDATRLMHVSRPARVVVAAYAEAHRDALTGLGRKYKDVLAGSVNEVYTFLDRLLYAGSGRAAQAPRHA